MDIRYSIHDLDDNLTPTKDEFKTTEYYAGIAEWAHFIYRANDPNNLLVPPIGLWTGREESIVRAFFDRALPRPNSISGVESCAVYINLASGYKRYNPLLKPEVWELFREIKARAIPVLLNEVENLKLYEGGKEICIAIERYNPNVPIKQYLPSVKSVLKDYLEYVDIDCSSIAVDIKPKGVNKGAGLVTFTEETGVDPEYILGSGDSASDVPMLERVKYAVCPANADDACMACVRSKGEDYGHVSEYRYVTGVIDGMKRFGIA